MQLPTFRYHPDPIATGSVVRSDTACRCCGQVRGWIYSGPVHAEEDLDESICPWCIADGAAHEAFGATFVDEEGIGGHGDWDEVPDEVVAGLSQRTPGFTGWQPEQWWTHCGDAAQFLGRAGHAELSALGQPAVDAIRETTGLDDGPQWQRFSSSLQKDGSPTAYLFRCLRCGAIGGYQDCD